MLNISLITVGTIKNPDLISMINDFKKRLKHYLNLNEIVIPNSKLNNETDIIKIESQKIIAKIPENNYVILMDIQGRKITSPNFAKLLKEHRDFQKAKITFIIGGSYGVSQELKKIVHAKLSFSDLTFPFAIFRLLLLEQIYRACKINHNEKYHK